jgi:hypothetical protein
MDIFPFGIEFTDEQSCRVHFKEHQRYALEVTTHFTLWNGEQA